ncbi:MAG: hypothetical protein M3R70_08035 [Actinomycetota bacterium]|nr:hypothetical protein [Actinomycetota bacterium]
MGAAIAGAAPPRSGVLRPGASLGGLRLATTPAQVRRAWGRSYGVCRSCRDRTWYFNYSAFKPQGAGVVFRGRRVAAIFTLWRPSGWRSADGLRFGDPVAQVTARYPRAARTTCDGYFAYTIGVHNSRTDFYVLSGKLWGFGLRRPSVPPCR